MSALKQLKKSLEGKRCLFCQAEFTRTRSDKKYCSNSCKSKMFEVKKRSSILQANVSNTSLENIAPKLRVIKGGLYPSTQKEKAIENFWLVCKAAFWNTQLFTEEQEQEFKTLITAHFEGSKNLRVTFEQLVERVCLAKHYLTRRNRRYISKPVDWLNINYANGLASTANWYKVVEDQRKLVPHYNEGIALFAEAMHNYTQRKSTLEMLYYRKELIQLKQHDLLQLYMNCIIHIQYFNN